MKETSGQKRTAGTVKAEQRMEGHLSRSEEAASSRRIDPPRKAEQSLIIAFMSILINLDSPKNLA
jgi:hypothetical protein